MTSTDSKVNSLVFGMLLQNGMARAPAGMMSSVEMSSPSFSRTGTVISSGMMSSSGIEAMFGVFSSAMPLPSSSDKGGTSMAVFTMGAAGSSTLGYAMPRV